MSHRVQDKQQNSYIDTLYEDNIPFRYIDSSEYGYIINQNSLPYALKRGGIFMCLEGAGEVIYDDNKYCLRPHTMCVAFPGTIIQSLNMNEEFRSYTMAIDFDFIGSMNIPTENALHLMMRKNPCMILTPEQESNILDICEMMSRKNKRQEHPFVQKINSQLLGALCYELAGIYSSFNPLRSEPCTKQDLIFRRFLTLLATDITISREVNYYAQKLNITPKYLTIITRQLSNRSATDWISRSVVINAKSLLATTQLSIQEVAVKLNFANPSFFGQYFLRYTGMTPREYRISKQR